MKIISADERLAEGRRIKAAIFGPSGVGKTSLLRTLTIPTLFVDMEGGDLSVSDVPVDSVRIRKWQDAVNLACLIGGPNESLPEASPYSAAHFAWCEENIGPREELLGKYELIFLDSITVLSRMCMQWAEQQPEAFNSKGQKDTRGAYGLLGRSMLQLLTHVQHTRDKHIVFVGILDQHKDDFGRATWEPQTEGSKIGRELPGIVDEVMSLVWMNDDDGVPHRVFVTAQGNPNGYPAKDRSGRLAHIEPANLQAVIDKINNH